MTEPFRAHPLLLLLFFFVHFCHVCVQKDLCTKRHPQLVQDKQARTVVRAWGSRGVGQSLRVGFMNFHNAWLSGLSGGPSACEFRGNYLQTKNAERTERRRSRGSWRKTRNHFPARFNEKTREKKHTQNKRERNVNNAYHSDERQLSNITPQLEPQHKRG